MMKNTTVGLDCKKIGVGGFDLDYKIGTLKGIWQPLELLAMVRVPARVSS